MISSEEKNKKKKGEDLMNLERRGVKREEKKVLQEECTGRGGKGGTRSERKDKIQKESLKKLVEVEGKMALKQSSCKLKKIRRALRQGYHLSGALRKEKN